ncbi:MAG: superoxide dismutase family protein [Janthinobacterium lividum]
MIRPVVTIAVCAALAACATPFGVREKQATATLLPTRGSEVVGTVDFTERSDGVQMTYNIRGLPPESNHAVRIHERGDCSSPDAKSALGEFDPDAGLHPDRLRGSAMPDIRADADGVASGFVVIAGISLDGVRSVVGRAIIVHRDGGEDSFEPNAVGGRLACGTIRR